MLEAGGERKVIPTPYAGNGFEEQIGHFCDCVRQGLSESPVLPHAQTLKTIALSDRIREIIGVTYPQDAPGAGAAEGRACTSAKRPRKSWTRSWPSTGRGRKS